VADAVGCGGEVWPGRGSEYCGCRESAGDWARPELPGLAVAFLR